MTAGRSWRVTAGEALYAPPAAMTRLSLLVDLGSMLSREVDLDRWLESAASALATALDAERASLWLVDAQKGALVTRVAVLPEVDVLEQPLDRGLVGHVATTGETVRIDDAGSDARFDPSADRKTGFVTRSVLAVPVRENEDAPVRGVVQVLNHRGGAFDADDADYLLRLGRELGKALALTSLAPTDARDPGLVLRGPFNRIIGRGPAMEAVYGRIALAAATDATVLFTGETGTGKTLLARAIHVNSPRREGPFVTLDCTTLPAPLFESELFGHERGAFTGADRRVVGRVETAEKGTLFLDEIGELPPETQGKLLRFLQERTFERVGGRVELRADVRVVAATHRDLSAEVDLGRFRRDLYYRVKVLEIPVPPLRERGRAEIERLARHFADLYGKRYGRREPRFEDGVLERLASHPFEGNVRELEHWIESAIVLAPDGLVRKSALPSMRASIAAPGVSLDPSLTLDAAGDAYIRATVERLDGNQSAAARQLKVSRNTIARALKPPR
jgi:transcriptional regulator with GAF, ATPase, and Fis domain